MSSQSFCRLITLVVALVGAPLAGGLAHAQASGAPSRQSTAQPEPARARQAAGQRADSSAAAASSEQEPAGSALGDAERAVAAFTLALRELGKPETWSGATSPKTSGLRLLSTPLGRLASVLAFFGVTVWTLFNPRRALIVAAWISGFSLMLLGERTGRMWVGLGSTLLYWALLHWFLQRAESRRGRPRTAWGDG